LHVLDGLAQRVVRGFTGAALGAPARMKFYPFHATLSTGSTRAAHGGADI
jgi:hypothetical protein